MKTLFKHLLTITLIALFAALALGSAGSSPSSYNYSGSYYDSSSTQREYIVTVTGYDSRGVMMQGQWWIYASSQSAAREEGLRYFLAEIPDATHVNALALLAP